MFKKRFACGVLVLVTLCLVAVYAPSQDSNRSPLQPPARVGVTRTPPDLYAPASQPAAAEDLRQLVRRLTEVRRQREALDMQEAELVAKIREAVATQRADLNRVELLLREYDQGRGRGAGKAPVEKKATTEEPLRKGKLLDKRP